VHDSEMSLTEGDRQCHRQSDRGRECPVQRDTETGVSLDLARSTPLYRMHCRAARCESRNADRRAAVAWSSAGAAYLPL
jgi:hypothetical protein